MSSNSSHACQILVVEDDKNLREALVDTLQLNGFDIVEADSAEQALMRLEETQHFDLIISDVNMGKMSGHDLLMQVKKDFPQIPVLLVTAYASISDSVEAMRNGAVDYLVKPFEAKILMETIGKYVVKVPISPTNLLPLLKLAGNCYSWPVGWQNRIPRF